MSPSPGASFAGGPPKVLIDLRCLDTASGPRGVGRYTRELVGALRAAAGASIRLAGLSWSGGGRALGIEDVRCPGPRRGINFTDRFVLPRVFAAAGVDLYHAPVYALPPRRDAGPARVLTVHDLVADVLPGALSLRHRLGFRRACRSAAGADRVLTVSETTRAELLRRYGVDPARVRAVHPGVAAPFAGPPRGAVAASGFPRPFLLYAGGLDRSKNVPFLLRVLARLDGAEARTRLVVAGEDGPRRAAFAAAARAAGLGDRVITTGWIDDAHLAAAYREAAAFLFPSLYEGFGLPPLEAMASGCPVVASPRGALREVLDGAAVLLEPADEAAWAAAIRDLMKETDDERRDRVERGRARAASFTWERAARSTLEVYREALSAAGRT